MTGKPFTLGDVELFSASSLRDYCNNARLLIRPLHHELLIASEELQAALSEVPGGHWAAMGVDQKVRARLVAKHLRHAAEGVELVSANVVRTYLSYRKHFQPGVPPARRRPVFDHDDRPDGYAA
ncbi:hypothetical protein N8J89_12815 [Crossiella sp. CA-258035]|uniref:hypothetical protein n=1 Tax=Crossiella sp. CA-258035 TaxID=2981138 RepID=UPI0024BC27AA|nr:hypothetical protein [Crossiella sp. CA-258035]WHT21902.1 hypothetical protein N8J89_12815 [Crossiella sp. CA-258035]